MVLNIATFAYFKALEEFEKHLPPSLDSELLVLKGHLLVEELLEVYLWNNLANPRELEDARLSFAQKLSLVAALHADSESNWLWKSVRLLNSLRNDLAHKLESGRKDKLLVEFVRYVQQSPELEHLEPPPEITGQLHRAIFAVHEALSHRVNL